MAQLLEAYPPGHWQARVEGTIETVCFDVDDRGVGRESTPCDSWREHHELEQESLEHLRGTGRVWRHQVADGFAYYYVVNEDDPVLVHIPYGDAYAVPEAHIRGLRREDIENQRKAEGYLAEVFS